MPLAEETGLILPIGSWVLETACAQIRRWESDARTRSMRVAVNISARQFRQPDFVQQVRGILQRSEADPSRLELELTERLVQDDVEGTVAKMHELKKLGLHFSLDNFGAGLASLTYLKRLPLDRLKIDPSFLHAAATDPGDAVLMQTVLGMAKNLGLEATAEGVETEADWDFLVRHGCPAFQGYLFSKPAPSEEFEALLPA